MISFLKKNYLLKRFILWYFLANTVIFWLIGFPFLKDILTSDTLFHNIVISYDSFAGKALVLFFSISNYLCFFTFLCFIPALLLLIISSFFPSYRFIGLLSILIASSSVIWLLVDGSVYQMYRFHLNLTLFSMIFNKKWLDLFDFSIYEILTFIGIFSLTFILECGLAFIVWKKIILTKRLVIEKSLFYIWLTGTFFCYLILLMSIERQINLFSQQAPSIPLYRQLIASIIPTKNTTDFLRFSESYFAQPNLSMGKLKYPLQLMRCQKPLTPYNIILIMVDALRFDSLNPNYMPNLSHFAGKSWQFKEHFSGGNGTQAGLFSLFYSLPANYWSSVLEEKKPPIFMDLLKQNGYSLKIFWSSDMISPPFNKTIFVNQTNLNTMGAPEQDIGKRDQYITNQAIQFLTKSKQKDRFFINLFYNAPHAYCRKQNFQTPFQPTIAYCSRIGLTQNSDPMPFYNRYLNAVLFVDSEIKKLLDTIETQGYLKNSIVIITSDHGQEFNDYHHNYWEHASNFSDPQTHVPFIVHWPNKKAKEFNYITSAYDLIPTLFKHLFTCQNDTSDYSIGQDLLVEQGRLPFILVGSYINMGLIEHDRITTIEVSGGLKITDKKENDLKHAKPRISHLSQALELMRRYYINSKTISH